MQQQEAEGLQHLASSWDERYIAQFKTIN
jgi:hypothetical protein